MPGGERRREGEGEIITEADLPPLFAQGPSWDSSVDSKGAPKPDQPEFASSALLCMPKVGEDRGCCCGDPGGACVYYYPLFRMALLCPRV